MLRRLTPVRAADFRMRMRFRHRRCRSFGRCCFLDFGHQRGADHGSIGNPAEYRDVRGQRDAETHGYRQAL